jgi:hypothetical protein
MVAKLEYPLPELDQLRADAAWFAVPLRQLPVVLRPLVSDWVRVAG